ncbi:hypothetical protein [Gimesia panareensis]|uniref:hypothetical protein n=1 Tax=Gimesia panareensis TaxID=2527978 RepID=UPI00118C2A0F|nr:hypothetical protein [Gimesia panareensis]QDU48306.1 hypothetical protein Pan110_06190 [Gimesia panareensis]
MHRILTIFIPVMVLLLINLSAETGRSDQTLQTTAEQILPAKKSNSNATRSFLEQQAKENFKHLEEDLASCRLFRVQLELSRLVQKYPHTKAGKRAQRLFDGGVMDIIDFPMKTSDNCYRRGVPYYRYSYGIYNSIPEDVVEGILLY